MEIALKRAAMRAAAILCLVVASEASAEVTVSQYRKMKDDPVVTLHISALIQGIDAYGATLKSAGLPRAFCPPAGTDSEKYLKALDGFLADRKAAAGLRGDDPIGGVLMLAMAKSYPCPRPK